jgi:hypothetical protein
METLSKNRIASSRICKMLSLAILPILFFFSRVLQADEAEEKAIQAVASLLYHVNEEIHSNHNDPQTVPLIFEQQEIENLWSQAKPLTNCQESYWLWHADRSNRQALHDCADHLRTLWLSYNSASQVPYSLNLHQYALNNLDNNSLLNKKIRKEITPYLLPRDLPITPAVDQIFSFSRPTFNAVTLIQAGFNILHNQPRSFIIVANHPAVPGMLFKVYLDIDVRLKKNLAGWQWFVRRCAGAEMIKKVIAKKKIKHFKVPAKYIYVLPPTTIPQSLGIDPKLAVLIVEDMHLVDESFNYAAWKLLITPEILDELYIIISRANGSSYRPDNIPFTQSGHFAFIDTEYPQQNPDFNSIRPYLSVEMYQYWDKLVKKGGP